MEVCGSCSTKLMRYLTENNLIMPIIIILFTLTIIGIIYHLYKIDKEGQQK